MMIDLNIDEYQCRICLENGMRKEFIAPCKCTGSSKWVHRICLDKWRSVREEKAFHKCTECLTEYIFLPSSKSSHECSQQFQFTCLVCRDLLVFLVVLSCLVGIFALFVFECDYQAQLISSFHMELQPKVSSLFDIFFLPSCLSFVFHLCFLHFIGFHYHLIINRFSTHFLD